MAEIATIIAGAQAATGVASGIAGIFGSNRASAADRQRAQTQLEANLISQVAQLEALDAQKDVDRARSDRANREYEWVVNEQMEQYYYEVAQLELLKEIDAQQGLDRADLAAKQIDAAIKGFDLQTAGLKAQYIDQEKLRAQQAALDYGQQQANLGLQFRDTTLQYERDQALLGIQATAQVRQYMYETLENDAALDTLVSRANDQAREIQNDIIIESSAQQLQYQASLLEGALASSVEGNAALQQTGGGQTSARLAADRMRAAYRGYGELFNAARGREARMQQFNTYLQGTVANQAVQLSVESAKAADLAKSAVEEYSTNFEFNEARYRVATKVYEQTYGYNKGVLQDVVIPTFALTQGQYMRELTGLQLETNALFDEATQPYRFARYLDVRRPTEPIPPEFLAPSPVYSPTLKQPSGGGGAGFFDYATGAAQIAQGLTGLVDLFGRRNASFPQSNNVNLAYGNTLQLDISPFQYTGSPTLFQNSAGISTSFGTASSLDLGVSSGINSPDFSSVFR